MITAIFFILMAIVFTRFAFLSVKLTWGFTKVLLTLVFLPFMLFGSLLLGLIEISLPVLIIIGIISLFIK